MVAWSSLKCRSRRGDRALVIALQYDSPVREGVDPLSRPHDDADLAVGFLIANDYLIPNIVVMKDNSKHSHLLPTLENVREQMYKFMANMRPGDRRFFFFAGHGCQVVCTEGTEDDEKDEAILLHDHHGHPVDESGQPIDPVFLRSLPSTDPRRRILDGIMIDNELRQLLVNRVPPEGQLIAVFDTCHSGTMLDLDYHWRYRSHTTYVVNSTGSQSRSRGRRGTSVFQCKRTVKRRESFPVSPQTEHVGPENSWVFEPPFRCQSPVSELTAHVLSLSSTDDPQRTFSPKDWSMLSVLLRLWIRSPDLPLIHLMRELHHELRSLRVQAVLAVRPNTSQQDVRKIEKIQAITFGALLQTAAYKRLEI